MARELQLKEKAPEAALGCVTFTETLNALQEIQVGHQKFTGKGSTRRFEAFPTDELLNGRPGWSFLQPSALLRMKQRSYFAFGQENDLYQWQQCPHLFEPGTGLFAILRFGTHNV